MFILTPDHKTIQNAIETGMPAIVAAGPGSGKTTTISELIVPALLKQDKKGGAIAFNSKNAKALEVAINRPLNVACATTHSTLLKSLKMAVNGLKIAVTSKGGFFKGRRTAPTVDKVIRLCDEMFKDVKDFDFSLAIKLVSLMKANALGIAGYPAINDRSAINQIVLDHSLSGEGENAGAIVDKSIDYAIQLMEASIKEYAVANYDDMIYMTIKSDCQLPEWDFLVYDEAQDIKPIEFEFIKRMAANGCQIIAVGDSFQAINHFTGCMGDSLTSIAELLKVNKLPLRTSYRCSIAAAELANSIFPNSVIPWDGAKQGSIENTSFDEVQSLVEAMDFNHGILSRVHKNLIGMALKLLSQKKAFTYKGIANLVEKMEKMLWHASKVNKDLGTIRKNLTEYQAMLEDKFVNANGAIAPWVIRNGETVDALTLLLAHCEGEGKTIDDAKDYLKTLADMEKPSSGPCLSTIHSAKGGQWENVYLVGALTSPLAKSEQQLFAEQCLAYVAYSRSSDKIVMVEMA
jgi:superfamily I DNA/RNA helicase